MPARNIVPIKFKYISKELKTEPGVWMFQYP